MRLFTAFVVVGLLGVGQTAHSRVRSTREFKTQEVIVKYKDGVRRSRFAMESLYDSSNVVHIERFKTGARQFEKLTLEDGADVKLAVTNLEKNSAVEYAQPNYLLKALPIEGTPRPAPTLVPGKPSEPEPEAVRPAISAKPAEVCPAVDDPNLDKAYGLTKLNMVEAWKTNKGSQDMIVAVIDTGVDYNHEDLAFNMWRNPKGESDGLVGWDFVHDDNLPFDDQMHGTHCAGVIGAVGGNGKGASGVNQRVSIMAVKFLDSEGSGDTVAAIKAIDYAIEHGAKVLSNSWGGSDDEAEENKALGEAIKRAESKGVLFVAAAGNEGSDDDKQMVYPASFNLPNMLTVAATDRNDALAFFSNTGKQSVHVAAPGISIYSTMPGNSYGTLSGTSMACPYVAGAAALVWASNPKLTYKEVKARLMDSVDKIPALDGKIVTGGRINVAKALNQPLR